MVCEDAVFLSVTAEVNVVTRKFKGLIMSVWIVGLLTHWCIQNSVSALLVILQCSAVKSARVSAQRKGVAALLYAFQKFPAICFSLDKSALSCAHDKSVWVLINLRVTLLTGVKFPNQVSLLIRSVQWKPYSHAAPHTRQSDLLKFLQHMKASLLRFWVTSVPVGT